MKSEIWYKRSGWKVISDVTRLKEESKKTLNERRPTQMKLMISKVSKTNLRVNLEDWLTSNSQVDEQMRIEQTTAFPDGTGRTNKDSSKPERGWRMLKDC
jgi:hypothetical protein